MAAKQFNLRRADSRYPTGQILQIAKRTARFRTETDNCRRKLRTHSRQRRQLPGLRKIAVQRQPELQQTCIVQIHCRMCPGSRAPDQRSQKHAAKQQPPRRNLQWPRQNPARDRTSTGPNTPHETNSLRCCSQRQCSRRPATGKLPRNARGNRLNSPAGKKANGPPNRCRVAESPGRTPPIGHQLFSGFQRQRCSPLWPETGPEQSPRQPGGTSTALPLRLS